MIHIHRVGAGRYACALIALSLFAGCAAPVKNYELLQEPYLQAGGGPLVIVDVCVQQDALGDDDDYHMVTEGKAGARWDPLESTCRHASLSIL